MTIRSIFSRQRLPVSSLIALLVLIIIIAAAFRAEAGMLAVPVLVKLAGAYILWIGAGMALDFFPRASRFVTATLPLIFYPVIYEPVHLLLTAINPSIVDDSLLRIDETLFGTDPIAALGSIAIPPLTDFAYLAYFSYYLGMPILLILMFKQNSEYDFRKVLTAMTLGWYGALLTYAYFPALGPQRYLFGQLPQLTGWLPTTAWIQGFLSANLTPVIRDCVPSMHTGVTILTLVYAYRYQRRFFRIYLIPGLGVIFATMYLQQHYVIDVILGIMASGIIYTIADYLHRDAPARAAAEAAS